MIAALLTCASMALGPQQTATSSQLPTSGQTAPSTSGQAAPQQTPAASPTQTSKPVATKSPAESSPSQDLPVSLDRIERALAAAPPLELKERYPIYRLDIYGSKPTLEDLLGEKFWVGPASYGGMTHQEFMEMSTPKEVQPYAGFTGKYLVATTALTLAEEWAVKTALHKYRDAKSDHERAAARKEVLDALDQLDKARRAAGLDKDK
jgi:hypothetical protein